MEDKKQLTFGDGEDKNPISSSVSVDIDIRRKGMEGRVQEISVAEGRGRRRGLNREGYTFTLGEGEYLHPKYKGVFIYDPSH